MGGAALIPLAIAAISYVSRGGFTADASLLNSARPIGGPPMDAARADAEQAAPETSVPAVARDIPASHAAMSSRALVVLIACGVLGTALLAGVKREAIGDFVRFQINAQEATARGNEDLRQIKIDPATYQHATTVTYTFDDYVNEYLRRVIGIAAANRIYREQIPSAFWTIRYFRDSQNEEYFVVLKSDGSLHSIHHTLDEKAPGANLSKEEAQARAEVYLRDQKSVNLADWDLVETHSDKKPARTDHFFEWEQKAALDAAPGHPRRRAHTFACSCKCKVTKFPAIAFSSRFPKPGARRKAATRRHNSHNHLARVAGIGVALIAVLVIFLRNLKNPEVTRIPWRPLGKLSILMLIAALVIYFNRTPQLLLNYTTAWPLSTFYIILFISMIFITAMYMAAAVLLLGLAWFFVERSFGPGSIPAWRGVNSSYFRDALCVALFGSAAVMGLNRLPALFARWPLLRHSLATSVPENLDLLNPAAGSLASAIAVAFLTVGLLGLAAGLIKAYVRPPWMRAALMILYAALMATDVATPGAFFREAAFHLLAVVALWYGVTHIARFNVLGYFLLAAMIALVPAVIELLEQPNPYLHANGYVVLGFAVAILGWPLIRWRSAS